MHDQFKEKIVLITGSTAGIGLATAEVFKSRGAVVIVCSRKQVSVDATKQKLACDGIACNVAKSDDRKKLFEYVKNKYGKLDVFVSNAACSLAFGFSQDCDEIKWDKMMETNLKAAWLLSQDLVTIMPPKTSSIVLVSSIAGYNPSPPIGVYGITKTGLLGLTRMLASEYGRKFQVRVNCVAPGVIETNFSGPLWESQEAKTASEAISCLARIGRPEEIAKPIAFLASSEASFITGETLVVAGGAFCKL